MEISLAISGSLCFVGYLIYRLGMISKGGSGKMLEFAGGMVILSSFIFIVVDQKVKGLAIQIGLFWIIITPLVEIILRKKRKHYEIFLNDQQDDITVDILKKFNKK